MHHLKLRDSKGGFYASMREFAEKNNVCRNTLMEKLRNASHYTYPNGLTVYKADDLKSCYHDDDVECVDEEQEQQQATRDVEYENYMSAKTMAFDNYEIKYNGGGGKKYAIALFSDAHVEETVDKESVCGFNEYNLDVAKFRITNYFANLSKCISSDNVSSLIFACLGDTISGFIHEELMEENGMTPPEAIMFAQSLIVSGLKYICEHTSLEKITFIGVSGNHSRSSKKIQSNNYKMTYEYIMYNNIKQICDMLELGIEFVIPRSEICKVSVFGKNYVFAHGHQIKGSGTGTVAGIYPALQRLAMKWKPVFNQDKLFIGHFHSCTSIPNATVNGSIIGYNAFAMNNGMIKEEPAQMYEVYDSDNGRLVKTRKIYCD